MTTNGPEIDMETPKHHDDIEWLLNLQAVHHARFSPSFGGVYYFYRRDVTSPSGMMLLGSMWATKAVDEIIDLRHICALSPTEHY